MTAHDNERLKRLERRLNWLRTRTYQQGTDDKDFSFDKAEIGALEWAIKIIEKHLGLDTNDKVCSHNWRILWYSNPAANFYCTKCLDIKYKLYD